MTIFYKNNINILKKRKLSDQFFSLFRNLDLSKDNNGGKMRIINQKQDIVTGKHSVCNCFTLFLVAITGMIHFTLMENYACAQTKPVVRAVTTTAGETEATQSLGVGLESRFTSGANPIKSERVQINPGTPLQVKATMDSMVGKKTAGKNASFGGILGRYDTTSFGKFFAAGSLEQKAYQSSAKSKLDNLSLGDNTTDNSKAKIARMYPPRYYIDPMEYPITTEYAQQRQKFIENQLNNVLTHFNVSPETVKLRFEGSCLILSGKVHSNDLAGAIVRTLSLEPGVEQIENRLVIVE